MEQLLSLFCETFNEPPITKNKWIGPGEIKLSNGLKIRTLSDGQYLFNEHLYPNKQKVCAAIRDIDKKAYKTYSLKNQIHQQDTFKINAGYKFLNRPDLQTKDLMKQYGTQIQYIFLKWIIKQKDWEALPYESISRRKSDILCVNWVSRIILFYEMKLCPMLDTTNGPGNMEKVDMLTAELQNKYPDMKIISAIFCPSLREGTKIKNIAPAIASRRPDFLDREIHGLNSLISILGKPILDDLEFVEWGKILGQTIKV